MYTTKDTPVVTYLATQGYMGELELVGNAVWFNYEDEKAEELANEYVTTRQKVYNLIFKLVKK